MEVVVVGHGPSLKGAKLGSKIDACDKVVRLKNCSMLIAERQDYGSRTDIMCSSTEVLHHLPKVKAPEYWCYPKKGSYAEQNIWWLQRQTEFARIKTPLELCNFWNDFFRKMEAKHPNVSTGMAAVIIALNELKPKVLYLAGFDNVIDPKIEGYKSTVPTQFNAGGSKDTGHDWLKEHELIPYLSEFYGAEIRDIAGRFKSVPRSDDVSPGGVREVREETA